MGFDKHLASDYDNGRLRNPFKPLQSGSKAMSLCWLAMPAGEHCLRANHAVMDLAWVDLVS